MHFTVKNLLKISENVKEKLAKNYNLNQSPKIIAVSKTFKIEHIQPLIEYGHLDFGENKVQEAKAKWSDQKKINKNLKLHMIGKLQSNKAKDAVKLLSLIHI